jgi:hypothetical protein
MEAKIEFGPDYGESVGSRKSASLRAPFPCLVEIFRDQKIGVVYNSADSDVWRETGRRDRTCGPATQDDKAFFGHEVAAFPTSSLGHQLFDHFQKK